MRELALWFVVVATATVAAPTLASAQPAQEQMPSATTRESDMDDERARGAFRLGAEYYSQGRFAEAAAEFERAYGLSGRGQLLYNAYLAHRDARDDVNAARTLRGYLAQVPDAPERELLAARLTALETSIAQQQAQVAATADAERRVEEARLAAEDAARPHTREVPGATWPWIVAGAGGAMLIGGAVTGGLALSEQSSLAGQCDDLRLCPSGTNVPGRTSTIDTLAVTTDVLLIGGGVIAATGIILGIIFLPRTETIPPQTPVVAASCTGDGCMVFAGGHF